MASVFKRTGNKNYTGEFAARDGRRVSFSCGTPDKNTANKIAKEREDLYNSRLQHVSGDLLDVLMKAAGEAADHTLTPTRAQLYLSRIVAFANGAPVRTLSEEVSSFLDERRDIVSATTLDLYKRALSKVVRAAEDKPLHLYTKDDLVRARAAMKKRYSARTINQSFDLLRSVFRRAAEAGTISLSPISGLKPLPIEGKTRKGDFSPDEIRCMVSEADPEMGAFIRVAALTGLRQSDLVRLSHKNVEGNALVISAKKTRRGAIRILHIPLAPEIREWAKCRVGPFFPTLSQKTAPEISRLFKSVMRSSGVPEEMMRGGEIFRRSFHSLRHTFISLLAARGVPAEVRQTLAGHSSPSVHAVYTHLSGSLESAIEKLPVICG